MAIGEAASLDGLGKNPHGWVSAHSELARLTVRNLPIKQLRRVTRHTLKKAVMVVDACADLGQTVVDKRATVTQHGGRYSRKGTIAIAPSLSAFTLSLLR